LSTTGGVAHGRIGGMSGRQRPGREPAPRRANALSRKLSYVLRHDPGALGLTLDEAGWVEVAALLAAFAADGTPLGRTELDELVAASDKQRFALDPGRDRIRAQQGHSVPVELGLPAQTPPPVLYHGTVARFLASITREGLNRQGRHHVHLSADAATARRVAARRGAPIVLTVDAATMAADGHRFYLSGNGVWLVDAVPARYLS
jgi:putative RNA 2'-phosphotransferase